MSSAVSQGERKRALCEASPVRCPMVLESELRRKESLSSRLVLRFVADVEVVGGIAKPTMFALFASAKAPKSRDARFDVCK